MILDFILQLSPAIQTHSLVMGAKCCIDGGRCAKTLEHNPHAIAGHLLMYHYNGANFDNVTMDYLCKWPGCNKAIPARNLVAHVMTAHVKP